MTVSLPLALLPLSLVLTASLCTAQTAPKPTAPRLRQAAMLAQIEVFAASCKHASWYDKSTAVRVEAPGTAAYWFPNIPIDCGNSRVGTFDESVASEQAIAAAVHWGVRLKKDVAIGSGPAGQQVVFEAADAQRKIAIKLRGQSVTGMFAQAMPEPAETDLDADEAAWLTGQGWRLFVAPVDQFPLMDHDQFTPTLALLIGLAEFLDGFTEGDDAALSGLGFVRQSNLALPEPEVTGGGTPSRRRENHYSWLTIDEPAVVRFGWPGHGLAAAKSGTASVVTMHVYREGAPGAYDGVIPSPIAKLTVLQKTGEAVKRHDARRPFAMLDASFDLSRPFAIELTLDAGTYAFTELVRVGTALP